MLCIAGGELRRSPIHTAKGYVVSSTRNMVYRRFVQRVQGDTLAHLIVGSACKHSALRIVC